MEPMFLLVAVAGAVLSVAAKIIPDALQRWLKDGTEETLEERVDRLTNSLKDATRLISNIENEIQARSRVATELQKDVERYNQLSELKKPEVEAVAQVLRGELAKEGSKSFWKGVAINFVFFLLGAGASWWINILTMK